MKILSAREIREWDKFTIEHEPIASIDLMERAAWECSKRIIERFQGQNLRIFCAKGNNGGDGLAIARQLLENGIVPEVYILEFGKPGSDDFQVNLQRLHSKTTRIHFLQSGEMFPQIMPGDLIIDALFGTGLNRPLEGLAAELVKHINKSGAEVISIDIPSGMFADQSSIGNSVIKATATFSFQLMKLCFLLAENAGLFGSVEILDIGLHLDFYQSIKTKYEIIEWDDMKKIYRPRSNFSHKGTYGHTLVVAGEKGKMGAAIMCAKACGRSGSGLVTALVPDNEMPIIQTAFPEGMAISIKDDIQLNKYNSIAIGPGIGTTEYARLLVEKILTEFEPPLVADADALNILGQDKNLLTLLPKGSILTPHPKEFERVFGKTNNQFERLDLAMEKAKELNCCIIIKGFYSFIATPAGKGYFNSTGNPGMATGGTGDVLTGILAGLLAQGYNSEQACLLGVYLHGLAGDFAAQNLSQEALLAGDITKYLGEAFQQFN